MSKIAQFCYYGDNHPYTNTTLQEFADGSFLGTKSGIIQLKLFAPPGTKLFTNETVDEVKRLGLGNSVIQNLGMTIGATGFFEMRIIDAISINQMIIKLNANNLITPLVLDIVYTEEQGERV